MYNPNDDPDVISGLCDDAKKEMTCPGTSDPPARARPQPVSAQEPASVSGPGVWRGASSPMPAPYDGERRVRSEGQKGPRGFLRLDL